MIKPLIRTTALFLFLTIIQACGAGFDVLIEKPAGVQSVTKEFKQKEVTEKAGGPVKVVVVFPSTVLHEKTSAIFTINPVEAENTKPSLDSISITTNSDSKFEITELVKTKNHFFIVLDFKKLSDNSWRSFSGPDSPEFGADELFALVGYMQRTAKSTAWGLLPYEFAFCTGFSVAPGLLLTNNHCISTQQQCEAADFTFTKSGDNTWYGSQISRSFDCEKLISTSAVYDFSLLKVKGDPSEHYGSIKVMRNRLAFRPKTKISFLANNPTARGSKILSHCKIESEGNSVRVLGDSTTRLNTTYAICSPNSMGGDSGSPVFNYFGDLIGILWGGSRTESITSFTPVWQILATDKTVIDALDQAGVEWVYR